MLEHFNLELESLVAERTMGLMALKLADETRTPAAVIGGVSKRILEKGKVEADIERTSPQSSKKL